MLPGVLSPLVETHQPFADSGMNPPTRVRRSSGRLNCRGSTPAKSRNGLTTIITSQRMTWCVFSQDRAVGDALQSTVPQSANDDEDDDNDDDDNDDDDDDKRT